MVQVLFKLKSGADITLHMTPQALEEAQKLVDKCCGLYSIEYEDARGVVQHWAIRIEDVSAVNWQGTN